MGESEGRGPPPWRERRATRSERRRTNRQRGKGIVKDIAIQPARQDFRRIEEADPPSVKETQGKRKEIGWVMGETLDGNTKTGVLTMVEGGMEKDREESLDPRVRVEGAIQSRGH